MTLRTILLGFAAVSLASVGSIAPAIAADADENQTTRNLNMQQLDSPSVIYHSPAELGRSTAPESRTDAVSLEALDHPRAMLTGPVIERPSGQPLGRVERVSLNDRGRPLSLDVNLEGFSARRNMIVTIDASEVYFDTRNRIVRTDLTGDQMRDLPRTYPD